MNKLFLDPTIHPKWEDFLKQEDLVRNLVEAHGSPLNIVMPEISEENLEGFSRVFENHKLRHRIYYAHKANKSKAVVKQLSKTKAFIDVASKKELESALSNGFVGERIEATGPKSREFLLLCMQHGVLINLDNITEINNILKIRENIKLKYKTKILIRISEFESKTHNIIQKDSRFGFTRNDVDLALEKISLNKNELELKGFSFHLASQSTKERVIAVENCISYTNIAIKAGLNPKVINIGGGFGFNFLESKDQWDNYISSLKKSITSPGSDLFTWNNSGLGFRSEQGTLTGTPAFNDFYRSKSAYEELNEVLTSQSNIFENITIANLLQESGLAIFVEPGRSMLNQVGITIARVLSIKKSQKGENIIVLEMNRSNLSSQDLEYLVDPIIISDNQSEHSEEFPCFLAGNLCLPHDFIAKRKFFLKKKPTENDLFVFINTSGYFMDFSESETLQQPLATKIAITKKDDNFSWVIDSNFSILN